LIDGDLFSPERAFSEREPAEDLSCKIVDIQSKIMRSIPVELLKPSRKLAHRALVVAVEEVVKADRDLNEPLKEQPVISPGTMPEVFERIVAFKEETAIKFLDSAGKLLVIHQFNNKKKNSKIQSARQILKYFASG
jgi:hypothetical protein